MNSSKYSTPVYLLFLCSLILSSCNSTSKYENVLFEESCISDWENQRLTSINKLDPRADFFPYETKELADNGDKI